METERPRAIPLAVLLRMARATAAGAIRAALEEAGYDDLPANGPYVLGAISAAGLPLAAIIDQLQLSKQAAGHLVDLLVLRGYIDRQVDPDDRRRLLVRSTDRGEAAAAVARQSADRLEAHLVAEVGQSDLEATRRTLGRLAAFGTHNA